MTGFLDSVQALTQLGAAVLAAKKPPKRPKVPTGPLGDGGGDDERETQEQRDERHDFLVGWYKRLRSDVEYRVEQLTEQLADGELDSQQWAAAFRKELTDAHAESHSIGRRLAGQLGAFSEEDQAAGKAAWERQEKFFEKFLADIESGRYTKPPESEDEADDDSEEGGGSLNEAAVNARAKQYVSATRGTVHESFRVALGKERTNWVLGVSDHCKPSKGFPFNCPDLARQSPKPADEWETAPARGDCPCRGNCTCAFETEDGSHSTKGI